jgi:ATP-binding cassette subfamily F protein 3
MGELTLFPGKVDEYIEYQQGLREHDERTNASIAAKRKQLQDFIDRNRARASTATRAKSKSKMLERLEVKETTADHANAVIRAPDVEPRQGPALRTRDLSIGYPNKTIATNVGLEIDHGTRAAIVGDNGQGKTTLLRTLVDSLAPVAGEVKWGYGCELGTYAQHVYTSLPENKTVLEHLEYEAIPGTKNQTILDTAGAMLFRGSAVNKKVKVLSGGERARLCMAALLLGKANVLILDEPGNHLDVETVEALADALIDYKGTVIFTSHDRHFLKRVATTYIEVRDGKVTQYRGDYDAYMYMVQKEIDDAESSRHPNSAKKIPAKKQASKTGQNSSKSAPILDDRTLRKQIANLEKSISRLDQQKKEIHKQMMSEIDPQAALKLHEEMTKVSEELESAETRWAELQEQLEE